MRTPSEAADAALARAALHAAVALGFRPPTRETLARLVAPGALDALVDAARAIERIEGADGLVERVLALGRTDDGLETLAAAYRRLFGHTARGEVPCYETEYGDEALFQQPQELGDLAAFLRAFGLVLRPDSHERIDHVSCECETLSFLAMKEAYAIDHGDREMLEVTLAAAGRFVRDHPGRFAPVFARRLRRSGAGTLYAALGDILLALIEVECRRLGVAAGPDSLDLRPDPGVCTAPMGCATSCEALAPGREP